MTNTYIQNALDQMRTIHEEQTRRLVEQVLDLRKLMEENEEEPSQKDTVDVLATLLRNLK